MDSFGQVRRVLVLGAGSDIARAVLLRLGQSGLDSLILAAREPETVRDSLRSEIALAEVEMVPIRWDASDVTSHDAFFDEVFTSGPDIDLVLCAVGSLGHGQGLESPSGDAAVTILANFSGPASALLSVARCMQHQGSGRIVVLSSVAGVRTRRSNFVYGSAKAGLDAFAQGLGDALVLSGVSVSIVRPGFVETKMTKGLPKAPFAVSAERVASDICKRALGPSVARVIWTPRVLAAVFTVLRLLPTRVWRRLSANR